MRMPLALVGGCLMALALFALMLYMVAPPRPQVADKPVVVANFVRLDADSSQAATRTRQQAPQPPQAQTPPTPQVPTPMTAAPSALPALDLPLPSLNSTVSLSSAPTPSLSGLTAGAAAPGSAPVAAADAAAGGPESEVMPLNDVRPEYPRHALQRGIEGHVKLAFTINRAGSVENLRVLEASPVNVFEREARRAALRWRFAPRTENGLAVSREAVKTLHFRLQRGG